MAKKNVQKIKFDRDAVSVALMTKLQVLVMRYTSYFFSEEDDCFYFVFDDALYGLFVWDEEIFDSKISFCWNIDGEWSIDEDAGDPELEIFEWYKYELYEDYQIERLINRIENKTKLDGYF